MASYFVTLENGDEQTLIERQSSRETIRDLITDISIKYSVDVIRFELNNDGESFDEKNAPLNSGFLDKTVFSVLDQDQDEDEAEENTIVLTVTNYDDEKKARLLALKEQVRLTKGAWEAATKALKAEVLPRTKGGKRKTYRK